jgi:hypothetical protein
VDQAGIPIQRDGTPNEMAGETRTALTGHGVVAAVASAGIAVDHPFGFA